MKDQTMTRRGALRTVLSLGCGLCLPAVLVGCDTKTPVVSPGASPGSSPNASPGTSPNAAPAAPPSASPATAPGSSANSPATTTADAAKKVSPASVQYQAQPKGEQRCGGCTYFVAGDNTCTRVDGPISSEGWCILWTKKA